jgi:hypothetical protein
VEGSRSRRDGKGGTVAGVKARATEVVGVCEGDSRWREEEEEEAVEALCRWEGRACDREADDSGSPIVRLRPSSISPCENSPLHITLQLSPPIFGPISHPASSSLSSFFAPASPYTRKTISPTVLGRPHSFAIAPIWDLSDGLRGRREPREKSVDEEDDAGMEEGRRDDGGRIEMRY